MKRINLPAVSIISASALLLLISPASAQDLTASQIESIKAKLTELRDGADKRFSARTSSAGDVFLAAAQDSKKALDLYFDCHKKVNYDQEGRSESDFRAWRESQDNLTDNDQFIESLRVQLMYLGISCKAAEAESLSAIFPKLMSYVDGLSNLEELPGPPLLQGVSNSIFVEAYKLKPLLDGNTSWEEIPYKISGIYEKTILPHLRKENPAGLMAAWDKRIDQESRVAAFIDKAQESELEGDREQKRRAEDRQKNFERSRGGAIFKAYDQDDFIRDTLPNLHWGKLTDQYTYVDQVVGAQAMLAFLDQNAASEHLKDWVTKMETLLTNAASLGNVGDGFVREQPLPPVSKTTNGVPAGLE